MKSYESGNQQVAKEGRDVAKAARNQLEATIGESAKVPKVPEQKFNMFNFYEKGAVYC